MIPVLSNHKASSLPYEIINIIFDYLSDITDSGWILEVDNKGKVRLTARKMFVGIHDINRFKQTVVARYVQLRIQFNTDDEPVVNALEQPYRNYNQSIIIHNHNNGFTNDCRCYNYIDPFSGHSMVAYVEMRIDNQTNHVSFRQGCVYNSQDDIYLVSGFGYDEISGTATIAINPMNLMDWDYEGSGSDSLSEGDDWDDLQAAEALLELETYFQEDQEPDEEDLLDLLQAEYNANQILFELGNQAHEDQEEEQEYQDDYEQLQMYM